MTISKVAGYTALTILTAGISQAIGILGLLSTGIKSIYDRVQLARYTSFENKAADSDLKTKFAGKIKHYKKRIDENKLYAKAFACSLVSLSLNYAAGYLGESFKLIMRDIIVLGNRTSCAKRISWIALNILGIKWLRSEIFYPGATINKTHLDELLMRLSAQEHQLIVTSDGSNRTFTTVWIPSENPIKSRTVLMFHGNGTNLLGFFEEAKWLKDRGFNVLLVNRGNSNENITEASTYHAAKEALEFARNILTVEGKSPPNDQFVVYGHSMGSTEATFLASENPGMHLILIVPFSRMRDTIYNILRNSPIWKQIFSKQGMDLIARDLTTSLTPAGIKVGEAETNGLDNVARIGKVTGSFFTFYAGKDKLMSNLKTQENLATQLTAKYNESNQKQKASAICIKSAGHNYSLVNREPAMNYLNKHLDVHGLIQK